VNDVKFCTLPVGGTELRYVEQGSGSAVILVHGALFDHRSWVNHIPLFASRNHVIAPDLRYFGTQEWADGGEHFSVQVHANDLAALIRSLGKPAALVGWSYGGAVSLVTAVQNPDLVERLLLYEPGIANVISDPDEEKLALGDRNDFAAEAYDLAGAGDLEGAARAFVNTLNRNPSLFDDLSSETRTMIQENLRTLPPYLSAPPPPPISEHDLRELRIPAEVAHGGETRLFFKIVARAIHRFLPLGSLRVIDGVGHLWPGDDPAGFTALVQDFLDPA